MRRCLFFFNTNMDQEAWMGYLGWDETMVGIQINELAIPTPGPLEYQPNSPTLTANVTLVLWYRQQPWPGPVRVSSLFVLFFLLSFPLEADCLCVLRPSPLLFFVFPFPQKINIISSLSLSSFSLSLSPFHLSPAKHIIHEATYTSSHHPRSLALSRTFSLSFLFFHGGTTLIFQPSECKKNAAIEPRRGLL